MQQPKLITGISLLVVLSGIGLALVWLPGQFAAQYEMLKDVDPFWKTVYFSVVGAGGALLLGIAGVVTYKLFRASWRKKQRQESLNKNPSQMSLGEKEKETQANLDELSGLLEDSATVGDVRGEIDPEVARFTKKREAKTLEIVAFGTVSSGKSSLLNALAGQDLFQTDLKGGTTVRRNETPWPGYDKVYLVDTPGLGEVNDTEHAALSADAAENADLVLLVVDGPLRESENFLLSQLAKMEKRILVCLNKEDWYTPTDRDRLLGQLREQVSDFVDAQDVFSVRSRPAERTRTRVTAGGTEMEEQVEVPPDIQPLADRMMKVVKQDGQELLLANLLLQSRGLVEQAKAGVKESLDKKAWSCVDKYMWSAGGAAAISPLPLVDLAAGCAISSKMVLDLARIYKQDVDINTAVNLLGELGKNLIAILGVSAATPAVTAAIAGSLKMVPGIGTLAGGLLQGVVQAVITRWIGAVFIHYFRNEMQQPIGGLASVARREWEKMTSVSELRKLVSQARVKFRKDEEEPS